MSGNESVEVWKNTAAGMRWIKVLDRQGREIGKTVMGGRTFTISTFDRQVNQDAAAEADLDLFRNGTFVLVKESVETNRDEVESSDSLTDAELATTVHEILAKNMTAEQAIFRITSPVTLGRLLEALVLEDAPKSASDTVKAKKQGIEPGAAVERVAVAPKPKKEEPKEKVVAKTVPEE
jgi:hypothetical protein